MTRVFIIRIKPKHYSIVKQINSLLTHTCISNSTHRTSNKTHIMQGCKAGTPFFKTGMKTSVLNEGVLSLKT